MKSNIIDDVDSFEISKEDDVDSFEIRKEDEEFNITHIREDRKKLLKIRLVPEIENESGAWIKLNNAEPIISNTENRFTYFDPNTLDLVYISLTLLHKEFVYR